MYCTCVSCDFITNSDYFLKKKKHYLIGLYNGDVALSVNRALKYYLDKLHASDRKKPSLLFFVTVIFIYHCGPHMQHSNSATVWRISSTFRIMIPACNSILFGVYLYTDRLTSIFIIGNRCRIPLGSSNQGRKMGEASTCMGDNHNAY